jgi:2-iminobutanoate/2-iminopropanoate deaminase
MHWTVKTKGGWDAMKLISTKIPTMPQGPFSQAVRHGELIYVAGQVSYDGEAGKPLIGDIKVQTRQALNNLKIILEESGSSLDRVIKLTCILRNFSADYSGFNEVFREFFQGPTYPARTTFQAGLLGEFLVEIEAIALAQ